jgi:tetratricopeptide (TPR) repeat protein
MATARVRSDLEAGMHRTERKRGARRWLALVMAATLAAATLATGRARSAIQSIDDLRRAVAQRPADAEAWTLLGDALLAAEDLVGAKEAYLEAIAIDYLVGRRPLRSGPGRVRPRRLRGRAVLVHRGHPPLRDPLRRALQPRRHAGAAAAPGRVGGRLPARPGRGRARGHPEDRLNAWTGLGTQLVLAGEPGSAADAFAEALKLDPDDTDLAYRRGSALLSAGRGLEALAELTDIEARTSDYRFSSLIAEVYLEQGQVDRALRALERAERKAQAAGDRSGQAASLIALGEIQRGLGREADATASYGRAAEVDPTSWEARYALGVSYLTAGQPRSAVAPLLEAVVLVPDNGDVRLALASAYDQMGQSGDALAAAREALSRATSPEAQAQARFIIGRALYLQGNYAGRRERVRDGRAAATRQRVGAAVGRSGPVPAGRPRRRRALLRALGAARPERRRGPRQPGRRLPRLGALPRRRERLPLPRAAERPRCREPLPPRLVALRAAARRGRPHELDAVVPARLPSRLQRTALSDRSPPRGRLGTMDWLRRNWPDMAIGLALVAVIAGIVATLITGGSFFPVAPATPTPPSPTPTAPPPPPPSRRGAGDHGAAERRPAGLAGGRVGADARRRGRRPAARPRRRPRPCPRRP